MLVYNPSQKPVINQLRTLGWDNDTIQKYLKYQSSKQRQKNRGGRTAFKDSQKTKVYKVEWKWEEKYGRGKQFDNIKQCQRFVNKVLKSKMWQKLHDRASIDVSEKRENSQYIGMAYGSRIELTKQGMNEYVILHEMAHCAGNMHHDASFRIALVKLVSRFMGYDKAQDLKKMFKAAGLKMTQTVTIKDPESWLKSYEHMKKVRAGG